MKPLARVGDTATGICVCHLIPISVDGVIISGSSTVTSENKGNARIGDMVLAACGHFGVIVQGSGNVIIEGSGAAHVGDLFVGCFNGVITSGTTNVLGN